MFCEGERTGGAEVQMVPGVELRGGLNRGGRGKSRFEVWADLGLGIGEGLFTWGVDELVLKLGEIEGEL